jgi:TP901 family phage tail tape measure protein
MADDDFGLSAPITADDSGFQAAFDRMESSLNDWGISLEKMYDEGDEVFKKFGVSIDQFAEKLGTSGPVLAGLVGVGLVAKEVGEKILEVGEEFDEASSTIARTTGTSGSALEGMSDSFEKLMGSGISQNINDVAAGFSMLSVKLGVSGESLGALTKDFAEYAEVTGTSVREAVASVTDVMNKWNISAEDAPELLDQLTEAAQLSGVSASTLAEELKAGGAQLQELGLSLTDSTALLAAFGKDGVNAQSVLTGLRTAVKEYAKEGVDASTALEATFDQIKNAKSPTEALTIAINTFGQRAGPELANAIRSGKASIEDFEQSISTAGGKVKETAESSQTLGEKWSATMNELKSAVAPIGDVFVEVGKAVIQELSDIITAINAIVGPVFTFIKQEFANVKAAIDDAFRLVGDLVHGNWQAAWVDAQLIVLTMVKNIADMLSSMVNVFIGTINSMINTADKVLDRVRLHIEDIKNVSLSAVLGIDDALKKLQKSIDETGPKKSVNLGRSATTGTGSSAPVADSKDADSWAAKAAEGKEKELEKEKEIALERVEASAESFDQILAVEESYDDQILASFTTRIQKERTASLAEAKAKGDDAATVATINATYDEQITAFHDAQVQKRAEFEKKYQDAEEKEADAINKKYEAGLKVKISGPIHDTANHSEQKDDFGSFFKEFSETLKYSFKELSSALAKKTEAGQVASGGGVGGGSSGPFGALGSVLSSVISSFAGMISTIGTVKEIMSPIMTILQAAFKVLQPMINAVLQPLINVLDTFGVILADSVMPIFSILTPIIDLVAKGLLWIANDIFIPVGNFCLEIWNGIATTINAVLGWLGVHISTVPLMTAQGVQVQVAAVEDDSNTPTGEYSKSYIGYASGTEYATEGWSIVGEQGPELRYTQQGSKIKNAADTSRALGKSTNVTYNITSPEPLTEGQIAKLARKTQRSLAFQGGL